MGKIITSKNLLGQFFNKWKKLNDFDEEIVIDETGKKSKRVLKRVKYTKNMTNIKISEVKSNLNIQPTIDTTKLKEEEEKDRRKRVISLLTRRINNYKSHIIRQNRI
jgi:hypothetical protein